MTPRRVMLRVVVWLLAYCAWLWSTRDFHPTWTIAACATAILVSASAAAVYLNALVLRPRFARGRRWVYVISLCAVVLALGARKRVDTRVKKFLLETC